MSGYTHDLVMQQGILETGSELLQKPFQHQFTADSSAADSGWYDRPGPSSVGECLALALSAHDIDVVDSPQSQLRRR